LDVQLDTGVMNSCAKFDVIPKYYWKPVQISFIVVKKTNIHIIGFAHDFPLCINGLITIVNLYCFDTGSNILLCHDYVNKYIPMAVSHGIVKFTIQGKEVTLPSKTNYENGGQNSIPDEID
jgi:hypothetical protein